MRKFITFSIILAIGLTLGIGIAGAENTLELYSITTKEAKQVEKEVTTLQGHQDYAGEKMEYHWDQAKYHTEQAKLYAIKVSEIRAAKKERKNVLRLLKLRIVDLEKIIDEKGLEKHKAPNHADFMSKISEYGIQEQYGEGILTAIELHQEATGQYIDPRYLLTLGLNENIRNPRGVGDNGCSFGSFQWNMCAGSGRWHFVIHGLNAKACALDPVCSARRTLDQFEGRYGCNILEDGTITNWKHCLSNHQGFNYNGWYKDKTIKHGGRLGL